jgi:hypothetical protein
VRDPGGLFVSDTLFVRMAVDGVETRRLEGVPDRYALYDNYPNPFNPETTIRYGLPRPGRVRLRVFNLRGQLVATLLDGFHPAGVFEVTWRTGSEASGMYFTVIESEGWKQVKRMTLIR